MSFDLQPLSNLVWELRFLSMAAQTAHWRVFGPTSYSDHQLFGLIYEKLNGLLDPLAERLTAFSEFDDSRYVSPVDQARYVFKRMKQVGPQLERALLDSQLAATFFYEQLLTLTRKLRTLSAKFRTEGYLTYGLDDMLASSASELETLVYFLERRSQQMAPLPAPTPGSPPVLNTPIALPPALVFGPRGV